MKLYIYRNQTTNYISIIEDVIKDEEIEDDFELLYIIDSSKEKIYLDLRPYQVLSLGSIQYRWNSDVSLYFSEKKYELPSEILETITDGKAIIIIDAFKTNLKKLIELGLIPDIKPKLSLYPTPPNFKYKVDIFNYLSDIYTEKIVDYVIEYQELSEDKKRFISDVNKLSTKDKKLRFINEKMSHICGDEVIDVLSFLPEWYRLSYKVSGQSNEMETREESGQIEYFNLGNLGKDDIQIQKEATIKLKETIYQVFDIGKTYSGSYILEKLREIYKSLGIQKTAKIKDIYEFFEYKKVNLRYHISEYKLETRKIY